MTNKEPATFVALKENKEILTREPEHNSAESLRNSKPRIYIPTTAKQNPTGADPSNAIMNDEV